MIDLIIIIGGVVLLPIAVVVLLDHITSDGQWLWPPPPSSFLKAEIYGCKAGVV